LSIYKNCKHFEASATTQISAFASGILTGRGRSLSPCEPLNSLWFVPNTGLEEKNILRKPAKKSNPNPAPHHNDVCRR